MRWFPQVRVALGLLALTLVILPNSATGQGAGPAQPRRHTIETIDGVKLKANFFEGKGPDGLTILLLHNFDKGGGDSQKDGWNSLATALQKAGHNVLSFDFRGHGQSLSVDPEKFFNATEFPHNIRYLKVKTTGGKYPETISHTDFDPRYYPFLVNDITAVRAFLDRLNDSGQINTSNIVVIGAGQGGTLGALWMASEFKRRQMIPLLPNLPFATQLTLGPGNYELKEPAGKDLAAGIFLSISPTLGGYNVPLTTWLKDIGKEEKVPLAFLYGSEDKQSAKFNQELVTLISPKYKPKQKPPMELPFTGENGFETKLSGSQLLSPELDTENWIVKSYLPPVLEKRTLLESRGQNFEKNPALWIFSNGTRVPVRLRELDKCPRPIPVVNFGIAR